MNCLRRLLAVVRDPLGGIFDRGQTAERTDIYVDIKLRGYDMVDWQQCRQRGPMLRDTEWNHLLARLENTDVPTIQEEHRHARP